MYPIYSTGEWEEKDATAIFNSSRRFFSPTANGTVLPNDGNLALIIDADERVRVAWLCIRQKE